MLDILGRVDVSCHIGRIYMLHQDCVIEGVEKSVRDVLKVMLKE